MTTYEGYRCGIVLSTDVGVGVPASEDAEFWSLSDAEKIALLKEARGMCEFLIQSEDFDWLMRHGDYAIPSICEGNPKYMKVLAGMQSNPFASERDRTMAQQTLKELQELFFKQSLNRHPRMSVRNAVIARDQSRCRYCGALVRGNEIHIDHVVPYSLGGRTEISNLVVSCGECNLKKSDKTLEDAGMALLPIEEEAHAQDHSG